MRVALKRTVVFGILKEVFRAFVFAVDIVQQVVFQSVAQLKTRKRSKHNTRTQTQGLNLLKVCVCYLVSDVNLSLLFQLPPTLSPNPQRRIVEQFKRALFAPQNSSFVNLKSEVKKVTVSSVFALVSCRQISF